MTTQQDRRNREIDRRTSRHRKTGKPEDHRRDAAAESSAAKHRRFAGGAPAAIEVREELLFAAYSKTVPGDGSP
jgi:hypothetical protein